MNLAFLAGCEEVYTGQVLGVLLDPTLRERERHDGQSVLLPQHRNHRQPDILVLKELKQTSQSQTARHSCPERVEINIAITESQTFLS